MNSELGKIEEKARRTIERYAMLPENGLVLVGLSGGADSIALTHFLWRLQREYRFTLQAAHVNHGLRGAAADRDEAFARSFCALRGIPFHARRVHIAELASAEGRGTEECGRMARYAFFDELTAGGGRVATAHTASDNAETMLMNFARGAGTHGLRGIPPVRGKIIRPFITLSRNEIERYCAYYHLEYVTDETNLERDYVRNQIRLDAVPVFQRINPAFEAAATRAAEQLAQDDAFLTEQMERAVRAMRQGQGWRLDAVRTLPDPLLSRFLAAEIGRAGSCRLTGAHLQLAKQAVRNGGGVTVSGGIQVNAAGNTLFIERRPEQGRGQAAVPLQLPETPLPDGRVFRVAGISGDEIENLRKFNNLLFNNLLSYDTISNNMFLRTRRPGDCFSPRGRGVTKSLKKLFNEAKISPLQRARELLLVDAAGKIAWMEHFGPSQEAGWAADKKGPYVKIGIYNV